MARLVLVALLRVDVWSQLSPLPVAVTPARCVGAPPVRPVGGWPDSSVPSGAGGDGGCVCVHPVFLEIG